MEIFIRIPCVKILISKEESFVYFRTFSKNKRRGEGGGEEKEDEEKERKKKK